VARHRFSFVVLLSSHILLLPPGWGAFGSTRWACNPQVCMSWAGCATQLPEWSGKCVAVLSRPRSSTSQVLPQDVATNEEEGRVAPLPVCVPAPLPEARSDDAHALSAHRCQGSFRFSFLINTSLFNCCL